MADALVLDCLVMHDRPFNVQAVADLLATKGVKKPQAQRSLDALAQNKKIRVKEFGKTKVYFPLHSGQVLDKVELETKRSSNTKLAESVTEIHSALKQYQKELASKRNAITITQIKADCHKLEQEVSQLRERVTPLRAGKATVSSADYESVNKELRLYVDAWQLRKRIFNTAWEAMCEGCDMKEKEVFEDAGVDSDEAMNVSLRDFTQLTAKRGRALRTGEATRRGV